MIVTLSPAKILDFDSEVSATSFSQAQFSKEADELNELMKKKSIDDIAMLMKINPTLAQSTYEYVHSFDLEQVPSRQAAFVYNGIAYQGLDANTLSADDFEFAQKYLVIFSGLYGMLRPLDMIKPYRLELQTKLKNRRGANLYDFWKETLTKHLSQMMTEDDKVWVNLSSNEYSKVIDKKKLPKGHQIITPIFKEAKGDTYKQVIVYAKKARGMMARFIVQNKIDNTEYLKAFDTEGYCYSEQLSSAEEWVFIR